MIRRTRSRRGIAATELALLLPFLACIFVFAVDWGRVFYYGIVVDNCARNGALYFSDPYAGAGSPYTSVTAAALADAGNVAPAPTVKTANGSDSYGSYVDCTVSYTFQTITRLPWVPQATTLSRTVRAYVAPQSPY